jgi:hypothetical protein
MNFEIFQCSKMKQPEGLSAGAESPTDINLLATLLCVIIKYPLKEAVLLWGLAP